VLQWCCYTFNKKQKYVIQNAADIQLQVSIDGITSLFTDIISHSQQRRKTNFKGICSIQKTGRLNGSRRMEDGDTYCTYMQQVPSSYLSCIIIHSRLWLSQFVINNIPMTWPTCHLYQTHSSFKLTIWHIQTPFNSCTPQFFTPSKQSLLTSPLLNFITKTNSQTHTVTL